MNRKRSIVAIFFFWVSVLGMVGPTQGAPSDSIDLKIMHFLPATHPMHQEMFVPWAKTLEERTGGKIKGAIYPGELLGKVKDTYDATLSGIADIGCAYFSATPGRFPLHSVYELPLMFFDANVASRIIWERFEKDESLRAEFRDVKVLWLFCTAPMHVHMSKKPVRILEDLNGTKVRTVGGVRATVVKMLGAIPVVIATPDAYMALERGTVDGTVSTWEIIKSFKFHEVTRYHTVANLWVGVFHVVMNKKRWESFPPDIQKMIEGLSGARAADLSATAFNKLDIDGLEMVKGLKGHEIINLPPVEQAKWRNAVKPLWDEWVTEKESKKLPGKKILDETLRLAEKYSK